MSSITAYPSAIARACAAVDESPVFADMPDGYFRVILRIVKKINLSSLNSPIFASRETLAQESGKSLETVHRVIRWLEGRGLILRARKAHTGLRGSSSPLIPTHALLEALTLVEAPQPASCGTADTSISTNLTSQSYQKQSVRDSQQAPKVSTTCSDSLKQRNMVKLDNGRTLPQDLFWMVSEGKLHFTAVLALMSQAKKAGKLLSDIVFVARKRLQTLQGKSLFAYCRKLISSDKDFGYLVRQQQENADAAQAHVQAANEMNALVQQYAGKELVSKNGKYQFLVQMDGILRVSGPDGVRYGTVDREFIQCIQTGKLVLA